MNKQTKGTRVFLCSALCCAVLWGCTSCSFPGINPIAKMRPPHPSGEFVGVEDALLESVGKDIQLVYPQSGEYRSAYVLEDLDGDGISEAMAFYKATADGFATHMNLLCKEGKSWKSVADMKLESTGIESVQAASLTGKGDVNLVLGCSLYNTREKQLNVLTYDNGALHQVYQEIYSEFTCADLNQDGVSELLMVKMNTVQKINTASLVSLAGETQRQMGTVELDPMITGIDSIRVCPMGQGVGAFVDGYKGANAMVTDIVCLDASGVLINPVFDPNRRETQVTFRESATPCRDVDGDGVLEIPSVTVMMGYENSTDVDRPTTTLWRRYNGSQFTVVMSCVMNEEDGYYFVLPDSWNSNVTLECSKSDHRMVFYQWDFTRSQKGEELLELRVFTQLKWNNADHEGYSQLGIKNDLVYAYRLGKQIDWGALTVTQVASNFRFTE